MALPKLKICGLKQPKQAGAIAALGVDAVGVIAVPGSPRFVEPQQRQAIYAAAHAANPSCLGVLVVADPADADLATLAPGQGHQVVQLHGSETPERCRQLRQQLGELQLWKALRIRTAQDLDRVTAYADSVDALLLDAWVDGQLGGTGKRLPLAWLRAFNPALPWWLAGGIDAGSAGAALEQLRPAGLDASSAVEHSPGDKDLRRVEALLAVVRPARQDQGQRPQPAAP